MPVFRRSSAGATDGKAGSEAEQSQEAPAKTVPAAQAGKGRPTPKRSEAERGRYRSIQGGTTSGRGTAARGAGGGSAPRRKLTPEEKARDRAERARKYEAMKRGDESALGPRDAGPVRRFARNYVDSHRRISNYMMVIIVLLIVFLAELRKASGTYVSYIEFGVIAVIILDAYFLGKKITKLASKRYPNESTRGLAMYAGMRALQIRPLRFPKPQVKPGDKI